MLFTNHFDTQFERCSISLFKLLGIKLNSLVNFKLQFNFYTLELLIRGDRPIIILSRCERYCTPTQSCIKMLYLLDLTFYQIYFSWFFIHVPKPLLLTWFIPHSCGLKLTIDMSNSLYKQTCYNSECPVTLQSLSSATKMERFSSTSVRDSFMGSRKTRGYNGNYYDANGSSSGSSTPSRKNIKTVKLGDANKNYYHFDGFKGSPSMSSTDQSSIWKKVKSSCYNIMHPKARKASATYSPTEFDNRVVLEIYKSMSVTSWDHLSFLYQSNYIVFVKKMILGNYGIRDCFNFFF